MRRASSSFPSITARALFVRSHSTAVTMARTPSRMFHEVGVGDGGFEDWQRCFEEGERRRQLEEEVKARRGSS